MTPWPWPSGTWRRTAAPDRPVTTAMPDGDGLSYRSRTGRWVIAASVLGSGMASIDATVVGIALPTIGRDFHATVAQLQWVVNGYTLAVAALLLVGGSLGDRFGRRRLFILGAAWFTVASVACALAPGARALIALRVLQGVGGALLTPGSLAILQASFRQADRGRAIGAWTGLGGVASAGGPFLGGWLIAVASWRWIFVINLPVGLVVLLLSAAPRAGVEGPVGAGTGRRRRGRTGGRGARGDDLRAHRGPGPPAGARRGRSRRW